MPMNARKAWLVSLVLVMTAAVGGCHYGSHDDQRSYGYGYSSGSGSGSYRDGFRDGRAYERRREDANDRYSSDWWRRRW